MSDKMSEKDLKTVKYVDFQLISRPNALFRVFLNEIHFQCGHGSSHYLLGHNETPRDLISPPSGGTDCCITQMGADNSEVQLLDL